jgi:hypothetical protein
MATVHSKKSTQRPAKPAPPKGKAKAAPPAGDGQ